MKVLIYTESVLAGHYAINLELASKHLELGDEVDMPGSAMVPSNPVCKTGPMNGRFALHASRHFVRDFRAG